MIDISMKDKAINHDDPLAKLSSSSMILENKMGFLWKSKKSQQQENQCLMAWKRNTNFLLQTTEKGDCLCCSAVIYVKNGIKSNRGQFNLQVFNH